MPFPAFGVSDFDSQILKIPVLKNSVSYLKASTSTIQIRTVPVLINPCFEGFGLDGQVLTVLILKFVIMCVPLLR